MKKYGGARQLLREIKKNRMVYLLISPFFIIYGIFGLFPIIYSFFLSFHKWNGTGEKIYVGLAYYKHLFADSTFLLSIWNTLVIWVLSTIPMVIIAIVLAFILNGDRLRAKPFFRTVYYLPNITSTVAVAIVFANIFGNKYGILNYFLSSLGLHPVEWLSKTLGVQFAIAAIVIWRWTGYNAIILLAGLQKIPSTLYEAARIDGATPFQIFRYITVPLLNPVIQFVVVTSTIGGWQLFAEPQMLVGSTGGIGKSGMTVVLYLYNMAFKNSQFGYGSAISWALVIIILGLSILNNALIKREVE
ncbi:MAG: sugar ABC transporter permease [Lachnospiraceae bacterium]|nr:sugar ABC transporter permease [Lachnospiraceae bacterium]